MAANVKALPKPVKPEIEEEQEHDCPKCPPVGAPAWMATFADMATLLMAFFVLILAFANFDEVSFKKLAGTMRDAFGTQFIVPLENAPGATVIEMDFRPNYTPPQDDNNPDTPGGDPAEGKDQSQNDNPVDAAAKAMARAIRQALADGELTVESDEGTVTVKLPPGAGKAEAEALADAIAAAAGTRAEHAGDTGSAQGGDQGLAGTGAAGSSAQDDARQYSAGIAEARLQVALREEIGQGLVAVERREDKVFVTVGAGGAFPSGSDDLTESARQIMTRLGTAAEGKNATVTVTGHTDDVQISGGRFRDNWDLASARASAVVRALAETGAVDPDRMTAVSRGESDPIADNATEEGRERNRRIEIEMTFDAPAADSLP